jgi:diguanylate cyclase (GGDEF)-like protein
MQVEAESRVLAESEYDEASGLWVEGPGTSAGAAGETSTPWHKRLRRWWRSSKSKRPEELLLYLPAPRDRSPLRLALPLVGPIIILLIVVLTREPDNTAAMISAGVGVAALLYGLFGMWLDGRVAHSLGLHLAHAAVYTALITGLLIFFLVEEHPRMHAHWIVFLLYFVLIGAMGFVRDPRAGVGAGLFTVFGYLMAESAMYEAAADGVLVAQQLLPEFGWLSTAAKISVLISMALVSSASAARGLALRRMSIRDPLTALLNRGAFDACLGIQARRAEARAQPLSVAMIDVDHFKQLNDTHGHGTGDAVLTWIASRLRQSVRDTDLVARYGGEEFVVAFIDSDHERLDERMEGWRREVAASVLHPTDSKAAVRVTVSIGVARFPGDAESPRAALACADTRLYEAKHAGRNRIATG